MSSRPWYRWFPADYINDTLHLTPEEDLLYRRLLDVHWRDGCIPLEPDQIRRLARYSEDWFERSWPGISGYFKRNGDCLVQERMRSQVREVKRSLTQKRAAANARWNKELHAPASISHSDPLDPVVSSHEKTKTTTPPVGPPPTPTNSPPTPRATRWGAEETVPQAWLDWAMSHERFTSDELARIAARFENYWKSKSGANATKLDWSATWQNWVMKESDDAQGRRGSNGSGPQRSNVQTRIRDGGEAWAQRRRAAAPLDPDG